jgi:hypothetical protein
MWGKVLPEMVRFLVKKPFGMDAPLGGLVLANHVYNNIQMQLQSDSDLAAFVKDHPEMVRMLSLLVPGTPWDIPVSPAAWTRTALETQQENVVRAYQGKDQKGYNPVDAFGDSASFSLNPARSASTFTDVLGELVNPPPADEPVAPPQPSGGVGGLAQTPTGP